MNICFRIKLLTPIIYTILKIRIFILFLPFFSFTPNEETCDELKYPSLKNISCSNEERTCKGENCVTTCDQKLVEAEHNNKIKIDAYNDKKAQCDKWEREKKEEAEKTREEEKEGEERQEEYMKEFLEKKEEELKEQKQETKELQEKKEQMAEKQKNQCERSYATYTQERNSIERQVQEHEKAKDEIEDEINKRMTAFAEKKDALEHRILEHRQERRKLENQLEGERDNKILMFKVKINEINDEIDKHYHTLALLDNKEYDMYVQRRSRYVDEYFTCYNQAVEKVQAESDKRREYIEQNTYYEVENMNELFSSDERSMEAYYQAERKRQTKQCFKNKTGFSSIATAKASIGKHSDNPLAMKIEHDFESALKNNKIQKKITQDAIKKSSKQIDEINDEQNRMIQKFKKANHDLEKEFAQKYEREKSRLDREREKTENVILALYQKKARLEFSHPKRHFIEFIQVVYKDCCSQGGDMVRCRQLSNYVQDESRLSPIQVKSSSIQKTRRRPASGTQ